MTTVAPLAALAITAARRDREAVLSGDDLAELTAIGRAADIFTLWPEPDSAAELVVEISAADAALGAVVAAHLSAHRALGPDTGPGELWQAYATAADSITSVWSGTAGLTLRGRADLSAGGATADRIVLPRLALPDGSQVSAWLDSRGAGVHIDTAATGFGQRADGRATVRLDDVWLPTTQLTAAPTGLAARNWPAFDELLQAAIDVGIAQGFLAAARDVLLEHAHPWHESGVDHASRDPHTLGTFGQSYAHLHALQELLRRAASSVGARPGDATVLRPVVVARTYAQQRIGPLINAVLATLGASSTSGRFGLDRYWRDVRTHSLAAPPRWTLADVSATNEGRTR